MAAKTMGSEQLKGLRGRRTLGVEAEASAAAAMCSGTARSAGSGITPELIFSAMSASWRARSSRCFWIAASSCWLLFSFSLASCDTCTTREPIAAKALWSKQLCLFPVEHLAGES